MKEFDLTQLARQAMIERGFLPDFSTEVIHEVTDLRPFIIPLHNDNIRDLRHLTWFSLDNDDSRDLDQITYAESLPDEKSKIYVAVANVAEMVKIGTAIDRHAEQNTTSIYTPSKIFPMLPERLSNNLTSLNPGEDRLAVIFEGVISKSGDLEESHVSIAHVHNHAQLAYNAVSDWLDGVGPMPAIIKDIPDLEAQIRLQDAISQRIGTYRHEQGALSVAVIETQTVVVDEIPIAIKPAPQNRGKLLIENFMIVANTISARFSQLHQIPSMRRVVVVPKRWDKIVDVAAEYNYQLPDSPDPVELEKFILSRKKADPITFPDLSLTIIKLLGNGEYRIVLRGKPSPGHFGLALRDYTHSTAPNRRYPDLITQRLLIAVLTKSKQPYTYEKLVSLAEHCTFREDEATKLERKVKKSAAAILLSNSIGQLFDGIVTGSGENGVWVRIFNPPVEGKLVRRSKIDKIDVGDRIRVRLFSTDVRHGYIDFDQA